MARPGIRADEYGDLQRLVDNVYKHAPSSYASNIDVLVRAEIDDLNQDLLEVINLIPAGTYKRNQHNRTAGTLHTANSRYIYRINSLYGTY